MVNCSNSNTLSKYGTGEYLFIYLILLLFILLLFYLFVYFLLLFQLQYVGHKLIRFVLLCYLFNLQLKEKIYHFTT